MRRQTKRQNRSKLHKGPAHNALLDCVQTWKSCCIFCRRLVPTRASPLHESFDVYTCSHAKH